MIQRRLFSRFNRATRLMEELEMANCCGPAEKPPEKSATIKIASFRNRREAILL